ncbi:MAG: sulfur oxidation c-type cytochrome SoxX [bacterium]
MKNKPSVIALLLSVFLLTPAAVPQVFADEATIKKGKEVAFDRKKGNCLACHAMDDGSLPGNQGPPLMAMQGRFPDKAVLRAQIYDPLERNPNTIMPPFGVHNILSDDEIDAIVEYLLTL